MGGGRRGGGGGPHRLLRGARRPFDAPRLAPSLALTLDENYRVKKAVSRNADADTFLNDEAFAASLIGVSAEEAALLVAERAAQTG